MTKRVRLGIVGIGAQGGFYGRAIADGMVENVVVTAVCDIDPMIPVGHTGARPGPTGSAAGG